jgi:hypothetical protein
MQLDVLAAAIGEKPTLEFRSGAPPASPAAADGGELLCAIQLPRRWLTRAFNGEVHKAAGMWAGITVAAGTAGHYRFKDAAGVCWIQGTVSLYDGGGGIELDTLDFPAGVPVYVEAFTVAAGNT